MITLKTYNGQNINPSDDAILYDSIIGASGIINGCEVTHLGANQLRISSGRMIIKGRTVTITDEIIYAEMSQSGTINGRLLVHMDLGNTEEPICFLTQAESVLPELVQNGECNEESGVYEIELARYQISETTITGLVITAPSFPKDLRSIWNNRSPILITRAVTKTGLTINAMQANEVTIDVSYEGYKPIGIIGVNYTNGTGYGTAWFYVDGNAVAHIGVYSHNDMSVIGSGSATAVVLYVKKS